MLKVKKSVSVVLALLMLVSVFVLTPISASAANGVQSKLDAVRAVYPNSCYYFTASGNACYDAGGSDCKLQNIPARGGLPSGAAVSSWGCWSCFAFAEYVFGYTFGHSFRNCTTGAAPVLGDVIKVVGWNGYDHYGIYLGQDANNYYVFDGNGDGKCGVIYNHAINKSQHPLKQTYHAPNYDAVNGTTNVTGNNPVGVVDIIESKSPGKVRIRGWVFDLDSPQTSLDVHVYIGGGAGTANAEGHAGIKANQSRPDVAKVYANHNVGNYHGFDATITTSKSGNQPVYVYGINIGGGGNVCIGNGTVNIPIYNPTCCLDMVKSESAGTIFVRGWAFDKDDLSKSIDVHVYIGGVASDPNAEGHVINANVEGKDVNNVYGCGNYHRFSATIKTKKTGKQDVHLYGINIGSGSNVYIGKGTVDIKPVYLPQGYLDKVTSPSPEKIYVKGWAFDRDNLNASLTIQIYIGGPVGSGTLVASLTANKLREDVNTVFPGTGKYHGFEGTISVKEFGNQPIYAYAQNIGSGTENPNLSQSPKTVYIAEKANNPITVKTKAITAKAKSNTSFAKTKAFTITKAKGTVSFKKVSGDKKITITKAGKITVKKGLKKGKTYSFKVKVTAAGNNNYKAGSKTVTVKIKVK